MYSCVGGCQFNIFLVLNYGIHRRGDEVEKNEMSGACSRCGVEGGVYRVLVGKPERKRPFGRPRRRWEDNIKKDLQKVGCEGMDWIDLIQARDS